MSSVKGGFDLSLDNPPSTWYTTRMPSVPTKQCNTKWEALYASNLWPSEILCSSYKPVHLYDTCCHSRVVPKIENIANHVRNCKDQVGASFRLTLEDKGKPCPLWKEFESVGLECLDFRCDVCDKNVPFHPTRIKHELRPHSGKTRKVRTGGTFWMTLSYEAPLPDDDAEF